MRLKNAYLVILLTKIQKKEFYMNIVKSFTSRIFRIELDLKKKKTVTFE